MTQFHFKVCKACGENAPHYNGVGCRCASCHKTRMKELRLTDPGVQKRDRERSKLPHRKAASRQNTIKWREKNKEAYQAQTKVGNALRCGKLRKLPCELCGKRSNVHAHHSDYSRPLDVKWLCAKCHHRLHASFPQLAGHHKAA